MEEEARKESGGERGRRQTCLLAALRSLRSRVTIAPRAAAVTRGRTRANRFNTNRWRRRGKGDQSIVQCHATILADRFTLVPSVSVNELGILCLHLLKYQRDSRLRKSRIRREGLDFWESGKKQLTTAIGRGKRDCARR